MATIAQQSLRRLERHSFKPDEEETRIALQNVLRERPVAVLSAEAAGDAVVLELEPRRGGERLRWLDPGAIDQVRRLSEAVRFLPKVGWKLPQTEMLLKGFGGGRWQGMALEAPGREMLVSYLDFALKEEGEVEVGFCMTHPDWRGRGLVTRLLAGLLLLHFDRDFRISTHESNKAMARALEHFGFAVAECRPADRINGETTLYLTRAAWTPFDLRG